MDPHDADAHIGVWKSIEDRLLDRTGPEDARASGWRKKGYESELAAIRVEVLPYPIHDIGTLIDLLGKCWGT